ncbi:MAG: ATP-dependent Clp protease adaptor ClpS [Phycisphaerales bacterium]|jgi:ATP-dependent Clp protease adaptor protein ClpS
MSSNHFAMADEPAAPAETPVATATPPKAHPAPAPPKADQLPPYRVLLHNDDVNDEQYVIETILELTPLKKERAIHATLEADSEGVALLLITHKEKAELYQEQFQSKKLTVTIEPAA